MATSPLPVSTPNQGRRIGAIRLAVAGALTAGVVFALCWLGTFVPYTSPTHAYIGLFTTAPIGSAAALAEGGLWSLLFGALAGALFALVYNLAAPFERR